MTRKAFRLELGLAAVLIGISWPSAASAITRFMNASTASALESYFREADANPQDTYDITLTNAASAYKTTKTLKLTKGTVTLHSSAGNLANAHKYVIDAGYPGMTGSFKRVFLVERAGTTGPYPFLSIRGITIRGGNANGVGGGIYNWKGSVQVYDSYIQNNFATQWGAGIYNGGEGDVYVRNSIIRDNINVQSQTNQCGGVTATGGGVAALGGSTSIIKTTVTGNQSCRGGGLAVLPGASLSVENSTISGNNANKRGGGLYVVGSASVYLAFNTITNNKAGTHAADPSGFPEEKYGGGIAFVAFDSYLGMFGNILAKNQVVNSDKATLSYHGHDCYDRFSQPILNRTIQYNSNFIGAVANCSMLGQSSWTRIGQEGFEEDPRLGAFTVKTGAAGPQYTHQPASNSPVIGNYYESGIGNTDLYCNYDDQLGHRRDFYEPDSDFPTRCDIGSHQVNWTH